MWAFFLEYILPILLGALIGYITNFLAIKMLFRPLRPVYIGKLKLPFTPGVFPRQRGQLAESLGDMVSTQLMNQETIKSYVSSPEIQNKIQSSISQFTENLLHMPIERHISNLSVSFDMSMFSRFFSSILNQIGETRILSFVSKLDFSSLSESESLSYENIHYVLEGFYSSIKKKKLDELIGIEHIDFLQQNGEPIIKSLFMLLFSWTDDPNVRQRMNSEGKNLVKIIISRLNAFQQLLINVTNYDTSITNNMPLIIEDVLSDLKERSTRKDTLDSMVEGLFVWFQNHKEHSLGALIQSMGLQPKTLIGEMSSFLTSSKGRLFMVELLNQLKSLVSNVTINGLTNSKLTQILIQSAQQLDLIESLGEMSLSSLFKLDLTHQKTLNLFFYEYLATIIDDGTSRVLDAFDVKALVVSKVNSLSMEDIEALLLKLMKKQLSYINGLGAVLGAVIGAVQLFL